MKKWKLSSTTHLKPTFSCTRQGMLWTFRSFRISTRWPRLLKTSSPPQSVFIPIKTPGSETKSCSKLCKRNSAISHQTKKELSVANLKSKSIKKHSSPTSTKKRNSSASINLIPLKINSPAQTSPPSKTPLEWNPKFKSVNIRVETACTWVLIVKSQVPTVKCQLKKARHLLKINLR